MVVCNYCKGIFCLYRPEKRCPSCGFSYCRKCCDNTIFVKQLKAEIKVCIKCSQYNSSGEVHMIPPPDCYRKKAKCNTENINNERKNGSSSVTDEGSLSTSNDHKSRDSSLVRESESEPSDDDLDDDSLEDSEDDIDDEEGIEREKHILSALRKIYPNIQYEHVKKETKSTDEILRDAIKRLREGNSDELEELRKKPPKCTLCSATALVNCKGCESKFCLKCFDLHSDNVCNEYETLQAQVVD